MQRCNITEHKTNATLLHNCSYAFELLLIITIYLNNCRIRTYTYKLLCYNSGSKSRTRTYDLPVMNQGELTNCSILQKHPKASLWTNYKHCALFIIVGSGGLEPPTPTLSVWCSNQLSYEPNLSSVAESNCLINHGGCIITIIYYCCFFGKQNRFELFEFLFSVKIVIHLKKLLHVFLTFFNYLQFVWDLNPWPPAWQADILTMLN